MYGRSACHCPRRLRIRAHVVLDLRVSASGPFTWREAGAPRNIKAIGMGGTMVTVADLVSERKLIQLFAAVPFCLHHLLPDNWRISLPKEATKGLARIFTVV
jgi:hypothetical protein